MYDQKVLITPIFRRRKFSYFSLEYPVQLQPFIIGLQIENISDKTVCSGTISNLKISSGEGATIYHSLNEKMGFGKLNPGETNTLWWPNSISTVQKGQTWISCDVTPDTDEKQFKTFQKTKYEEKPEECPGGFNHWGDAIFISSKAESNQKITNILMLILTLLIFFDGVWGLDNIAKTALNISSQVLVQFSSLMLFIADSI